MMAIPDTDNPWILALIVVGIFVLQGVQLWKTRSVKQDTEVAREQTANDHHNAPYRNLRDELTAVRETVERIDSKQSDLASEQGALASELLRHYENADERDRRIDYLTDALVQNQPAVPEK